MPDSRLFLALYLTVLGAFVVWSAVKGSVFDNRCYDEALPVTARRANGARCSSSHAIGNFDDPSNPSWFLCLCPRTGVDGGTLE